MKKKFYICHQCGNLVETIRESGVALVCCGQKMEELVPNTSEGAGEKHLPVVTVEDDKVTVCVGEVTHPMLDEHYIQWVCLETEQGCQMKMLQPGEAPEATFCTCGDKPVAAYEYCNIHGLWKVEIK